jgi:hypothetical protein
MASERAQKSEVHQTTDDSSTSPASDARTPKGRPDDATGASNANSGGGAGAGIPGGGTGMRMGNQIPEGDVDEDRSRLFPESQSDRDEDESDFGGPARIETDEQGKMKE